MRPYSKIGQRRFSTLMGLGAEDVPTDGTATTTAVEPATTTLANGRKLFYAALALGALAMFTDVFKGKRRRRRALHGLAGAKYQRRHYEDAVDAIKAAGSPPALVEHYVKLFAADNPRFSEGFFRAALQGERKHRSRKSR